MGQAQKWQESVRLIIHQPEFNQMIQFSLRGAKKCSLIVWLGGKRKWNSLNTCLPLTIFLSPDVRDSSSLPLPHPEHTSLLPTEATLASHPVTASSSSSKPRIIYPLDEVVLSIQSPGWDCSKFGHLATNTGCLSPAHTKYLVADQGQGNHSTNSQSVKGELGVT